MKHVIEYADKWAVSPRYIQKLCAQGRIPGAKKNGRSWMLPDLVEYPKDMRLKSRDGGDFCMTVQETIDYLLAYPPDMVVNFTVAPSETPDNTLPVLFLFHRTPGLIEEELEAICNLYGEKQVPTVDMFKAQLAYNRWELELAKTILDASPQNDWDDYSAVAFHDIRALVSIAERDEEGCINAKKEIQRIGQKAKQSGNERLYMQASLHYCDISLAMGEFDKRFQWIVNSGYEWKTKPRAIHDTAAYNLQMKEVVSPAFWIEGEISARAVHSVLAEILILILSAIWYQEKGMESVAIEKIIRAAEMAFPDGIIAPFVRNFYPLGKLFIKALQSRYPFETEKICQFGQQYLLNHWELFEKPKQPTNPLTEREYLVSIMAAMGFSNREISEIIGNSINSVKSHLSVAYEKMYITNRKEMAQKLPPCSY